MLVDCLGLFVASLTSIPPASDPENPLRALALRSAGRPLMADESEARGKAESDPLVIVL